MKLSDYVIRYIYKVMKVDTVFTFSGGSLIHLLTSIYDFKKLKNVIIHHEQAAAFAAESYSKLTGNIGIAMATSGPGATNLITGIGSCYFDSIPALFITGQVNTYDFKNTKKIRQLGFQETDIVPIVKPITKYAKRVTNPKNIKFELEKAYYISKNGRPGPALLDIPMNIQRAQIKISELKSFYPDKKKTKNNPKIIKKVIDKINNSERPVILAGGGIRISQTVEQLKKIANFIKIPIATTMLGVDVISHDSELWSGYVGAYGNRFANFTIANSDLLIVLGSRLTSRQTGTLIKNFACNAEIIHVDIDKNELNNRIKADISVNMDLKFFFSEIEKQIGLFKGKNRHLWFEYIRLLKIKYPSYTDSEKRLNANYFINFLSNKIPENAIVISDIGQNQIWLTQSFNIKNNQRLLESPGMGAMGCSLPAAIGAAFAKNTNQIYSFNGDGGIQINIQELHTIKRYNLPIKIIVLNNNSLGMIRQFQDLYFDSKYIGSKIDYSAPDFISIAKAYGIKTFDIKNIKDLKKYVYEIIKYPESCFVNVLVSEKEDALPKLEVNKPIEDQHPLLSREELKNNMFETFKNLYLK